LNESQPPHRDLLVALATLTLLLWWEAGGWDMALAAGYGNAQGFALRNAWFTRALLHDGARMLSGAAVLACGVLAWHGHGSALPRRQRLAWAGMVLLCLLAIPAFKQLSQTSCPWDLAAFGGTAAYVPHWRLFALDGGPGHCFPAGHAVAAFAFLPLYFQWRGERPALARALLAATLGAGALLGWTQLARGAHFPSHTLWSAWLCWSIGAVAARCLETGQPSSTLSIKRVLPRRAAASATSGSPSAGVPRSR
jgi:membrane-associated PAP2 superfamily phosphatase